MHIKSNKTHLNNVVSAKSTKASVRFPKLLNSCSELDSQIFWGIIFHIFDPRCRTN